MAKVLSEGLDAETVAFITAQPLFFVATAPASGGHVNVSPKGYDSLRVLGPMRVAYRDLTGSGIETLAHLADDGRITLMWCAFDQPPRIVRLQGAGRAVLPGDADHAELDGALPPLPGARAIVEVTADRVSSSCGYGVPLMEFLGERETLTRWAVARGETALAAYRSTRNGSSIDGLPGYPASRSGDGRRSSVPSPG
jgi:hypothetical protein